MPTSSRTTSAQLVQKSEELIDRADMMYTQMREMLAQIKDMPRVSASEVSEIRTQLGNINDRLARIETNMSGMCKRIADLEEAKLNANGKASELLTRLAVLEEHDKTSSKTIESALGKAWSIIQTILLLILTAVVSGLWQPHP